MVASLLLGVEHQTVGASLDELAAGQALQKLGRVSRVSQLPVVSAVVAVVGRLAVARLAADFGLTYHD